MDSYTTINSPIINKVSYIYVVGVEGTGHHGVTPVVASIAKTCNYQVVYENKELRAALSTRLPMRFNSLLNFYKRKPIAGVDKVLVLEDGSLPTDKLFRNSTMEQKKSTAKYDIEWIYDRTHDMDVNVRFLHLSRDFYRTVASHPEFDGGFNKHADVLHSFLKYIDSEYARIEAKQPNLWRTIYYEWFQDLSNCTALASAIIDFAGWNDCDVEFACEILTKTIRKSTKRTVVNTDFAYSNSLNTTLSIPVLDISENRTYNFKTSVSERIPFTFLKTKNLKQAPLVPRTHQLLPNPHAPHRQQSTHDRTAGVNPTTEHKKVTPQSATATAPRYSNSTKKISTSMIYLAGVRGVGYPQVAAIVASAGNSCGYEVNLDYKPFHLALSQLKVPLLNAALHTLRGAEDAQHNPNRKVLLIEGFPFHADGVRPTRTSAEIRRYGKYNLVWTQEYAAAAEVETKFLYLNRSFPDLVAASHTNPSLSVEEHIRSIGGFISYIGEEQRKIE